MTLLQRSQTGRLLATQSLSLILTPQGVEVKEGGRSSLLPWSDLGAPPYIEPGWWFTRLTLPSQPPHTLNWLPKKSATPWTEQAKAQWTGWQQGRLTSLALVATQELRQRYLSHSRWQRLVTLSRRGIREGLGNLAPMELPPEQRKGLKLIRSLSEDSPQTLARLRQHQLQQELKRYRGLFDRLAAAPLTNAQRLACVTHDDVNLVLGAAGTGKSTVLAGRIAYLVASGQAKAEEILVLAHDSADVRRLKRLLLTHLGKGAQRITVTHFQALALRLIHQNTQTVPRLTALTPEGGQLRRWLKQQVTALLLRPEGRELIFTLLMKDAALSGGKAQVQRYRQLVLAGLEPEKRLLYWQQRGAFSRLLDLLCELLPAYRRHRIRLWSLQHPALVPWQPLLTTLMEAYNRALRIEGESDRDQLLVDAVRLLKRPDSRLPWKHLMLDDLQQISLPHSQLLQAMASKSESLFALGDDWQGSGRRQGAELNQLLEFGGHFGPHSRTLLDMSFTLNSNLNLLGTAFISRNPAQLTKRVTSLTMQPYPSISLVDDRLPLTAVVQSVARRAKPGWSLALIGSEQHQLPGEQELAALQELVPDTPLQLSTFADCKHLTCHCVVILGLAEGQFPRHHATHPALEAMLPAQERFPFAEERRLLYRAMTRASEQVYLSVNRANPGSFAKEIQHLLNAVANKQPHGHS
ncbi:UvrD-helicase domain-containing protein [Ferrimonas sp. YFM]|uniref:UvrD-helicase domain-containing protein n=1 Tax=Ferrimonas sp. YFM TaxID=3028878 RepID=UPI0025732C0B|nr:UvrD-helicase domain-containing protein [Ferrimonas sp. YFM]BDY04968.1 DNA helicase [Ferrimonas sp. YFM]